MTNVTLIGRGFEALADELPLRSSAARGGKLPLAVKVVYTLFMAVLVPHYLHAYGPLNFLYFCDVAILIMLAGLWLESPLLLSMQAVAILVPQMIWVIDFMARLLFGATVVGMTDYMFDPAIPLFVRGLSSFHGWLPFLLVWAVRRVGYDRRALGLQTVAGVSLLLLCFMISPQPGSGATVANVNYVFGLSDHQPQTWMSPTAWIRVMVIGIPLLFYLPAHLVLNRLFGVRK